MTGAAPFSIIFLQVIHLPSGERLLGRFVGTGDQACVLQPSLFSVGLPDLQAVDLHVLPSWREAIPPPDWLKDMLTPAGWRWMMLPHLNLREELVPELERRFQTRLPCTPPE